MRRQICWIDRIEHGVKRETRVTFLPQEKIKWQFKRSDEDDWQYDTPPDLIDWDTLLDKVEKRYKLRNVAYEDVERVRRQRAAAYAAANVSLDE